MIKERIAALIEQSLRTLEGSVSLPADAASRGRIERTKDPAHGDFASNIALVLSKAARISPRELAAKVVAKLPVSDWVETVNIAGPGFINFTIARTSWLALIDEIRKQGHRYGRSHSGQNGRIMVEFVSANPTGPLHVGHGRGAAYGDALARILRAAGYDVHSEYYVNDAGRQMDILALSVWLRYQELFGSQFDFPIGAYQGEYVREMAGKLRDAIGDQLTDCVSSLFDDLPDETEAMLDDLVSRTRSLMGQERFRKVFDHACEAMVADIRQDLAEFGVHFQRWFPESHLIKDGAMNKAIRALEENGHIYEKDGAKWFRASDWGDEKDRVVVRANGTHTYFATDLAYHFDKGERGFDRLLDIFGADHHGYVNRIKASFAALGHCREKLDILLVQFAVLYRHGQKVSMSTRQGEFVTLRELREEVGNDAARFFYALRRPEQHMDFDLDLAKSQSADNPVYYIQYAHARICSVFRQTRERQLETPDQTAPDYTLLVEPREQELLCTLSRFPEVVGSAADSLEPHQVAYFLRDLATDFHAYYNAHPFLASQEDLRLARLGLIDATRQVIRNGLDLLGVRAPESM